MKNLWIYLVVACLFLLLVLTINIQRTKIGKLESDNTRLEYNQTELTKENNELTVLTLRKDEVIGRYARERDSLAEALKIKPKQVIQIKYQTITEHDTVPVPVPVFISGQNFWKIKDTGKCFVWQADAFLKSDSLEVTRTGFDYNNKVTHTYYKKRPHKFLFIRFGKWEYFNDITPECGEARTEVINFIK